MSNKENQEGLQATEADLSEANAGSPNIISDNKEEQRESSPSILVGWDGDHDPLDPRTFTAVRKWSYVAVVSMGSLLV